VAVPNVVGRLQGAATTQLQDIGLGVAVTNRSTPQGSCSLSTVGQVVDSSPAATTLLNPGAVVTLTVCALATSTVPNMLGQLENDALSVLAAAHLTSGQIVFKFDSAANGRVIAQSIQANTVQLQFTVVDITVSLGPPPVVVPSTTTWSEIFAPLINAHSNALCSDVPGGSKSSGTLLQLFHCHATDSGGGPQRWQFTNAGTADNGRPLFHIKNINSNLCMMVTSGASGTRASQGSCTSSGQNGWEVMDRSTGYITNGSPTQFELLNPAFNTCMAAANNSDSDGTALVTATCTIGGNQLNTWQL
jgi:hypothetical protein